MNALAVEIARKVFPPLAAQPGLLALEGLRFAVPDAQFTCIVGPSGCGKTTLLHIIAGLDQAFEGSVRVGDRAPGDGASAAIMFQAPRLMPWLSVRDNVRLVLDGGRTERQRAERLLADMGLGEFMDAFPGRLSGGMQRRVALARAVVTEPRLLLLDEPFLSLDAPVASQLRELLVDLWRRRPTTVLFVTHDLREALQLADRILFMSPRPGRIVLDLPVGAPRPRAPDGDQVEALRLELLRRHPRLLAGDAAAPGDERAAG